MRNIALKGTFCPYFFSLAIQDIDWDTIRVPLRIWIWNFVSLNHWNKVYIHNLISVPFHLNVLQNTDTQTFKNNFIILRPKPLTKRGLLFILKKCDQQRE